MPRPVTLAKLSLRVLGGGGGRVSVVGSTAWSEGSITYASAPAVGAAITDTPQSSRDGTLAANVTATVNADPDGALSFAVTTTAMGQLTYHSKEDGQPPRLVVTVSCAGGADADGDGRADACDCAPANASAFAVPREVDHLRWVDPHTLIWDPQAAAAGSGTRYDVVGGDLAVVSSLTGVTAGSCLAGGLVTAQLVDPSDFPGPGSGVFFLVRASNACGKSRYETSSDGRDRLTSSCP